MNLAEMLAASASDQDHEDEGLTDRQIVERMREIVAKLDETHTFEHGDIILHKHPSSASTKSAAKPGIFMGYLDEPIEVCRSNITDPGDYYSNSASGILDCRIGKWIAGKFVVYLIDSGEYQPHPDF